MAVETVLRNVISAQCSECQSEENRISAGVTMTLLIAVLHPILKGTTLGSIAEKAANYVDTLLPNQPAKGKPGQKMPTGRKKQRRILYASAQDQYRKDKGKLLEEYNLKKYTFSETKIKDGRAQYWKEIMETPRQNAIHQM